MKKDSKAIELACRPFCSYYKEGKEGLLCGTLKYLLSNYPEQTLKALQVPEKPDFSEDLWILENVCHHCEFFKDDCDFRLGKDSPPCGGYILVETLRKKLNERTGAT